MKEEAIEIGLPFSAISGILNRAKDDYIKQAKGECEDGKEKDSRKNLMFAVGNTFILLSSEPQLREMFKEWMGAFWKEIEDACRSCPKKD
jgi:hypothetical protein